jgi:cytochrome c oxidase cbb3-type subunit 2
MRTDDGDLMTRVWLLLIGAFAALSFAIVLLVLVPRALLVRVEASPGLEPYTASELQGRQVYIANGCVYCHSQQVRDPAFTTDVARGWGSRASVPGDYVYDRPHLLGTSRTGPDLLNVGQRLPDPNWQLVHLYDPRALNPWSIMPGFPFLFTEKAPNAVRPGDRVVVIPGPRAPKGRVVVAKPEALALTDYLLSLKRNAVVPASANARERTAGPLAGGPTEHGAAASAAP